MDEPTNPRRIAWFTAFFSLSKPQAKINSPSIYNVAKCASEHWCLNPLWLLKGWLHPSGWDRLCCSNKEHLNLSPKDDHNSPPGIKKVSPATPSFSFSPEIWLANSVADISLKDMTLSFPSPTTYKIVSWSAVRIRSAHLCKTPRILPGI